jgi:hypothetical protein
LRAFDNNKKEPISNPLTTKNKLLPCSKKKGAKKCEALPRKKHNKVVREKGQFKTITTKQEVKTLLPRSNKKNGRKKLRVALPHQ